MSEKQKEILASIAETTDKLDERGKAFLEGYITRAVQESERGAVRPAENDDSNE